MTEFEMAGWHHWLDEHEFEQALGISDGQESLACCSPWGCRVRHDWVTGLNWTELNSREGLKSQNDVKQRGETVKTWNSNFTAFTMY